MKIRFDLVTPDLIRGPAAFKRAAHRKAGYRIKSGMTGARAGVEVMRFEHYSFTNGIAADRPLP
jgi:hypothetical protein